MSVGFRSGRARLCYVLSLDLRVHRADCRIEVGKLELSERGKGEGDEIR